jgi:phage terminase large subunit-like protein
MRGKTILTTQTIIDTLNSLSDDELKELLQHVETLDEMQAKNPLDFYDPYDKQRAFHELGATKRERLLQAGNQTGKSVAGAAEAAMHATGLYPKWWTGRRFHRPTQGWICGASGASIRDIGQLKLFGPLHDPEARGLVAPHLIVSKSIAHGTADLVDQVRIRHVSGGISIISTKSYSQDVSTWMGSTLDWIWVDEEPPAQHYAEAIARLRGDGVIWVTFTPLQGFSEVVSRFLRDDSEDARKDRGVVKMGLKDAKHFSDEEKRQRLASYPIHERGARENGDPTLGSGAIFTQLETTLAVGAEFQPPLHFKKIWGCDFGYQCFAAVLLAWDVDNDTVYVIDTIRLENSRPAEHAAALQRKAPDVRIAYPADGHSHERGTGETIISQYKQFGLHFLPNHATHPDGGVSVEAGLLEMQQRMMDGRFRVKANLHDWFDEYRSYHRDNNGKIVKVRDHLLDATRYGMMMKRAARPGPIGAGVGHVSLSLGGPKKPVSGIAIGADFNPLASW